MKGVLGFDIPTPRTPATANLPSDGAALRAVSLMVMKNQINGADGYVILDSMGGHHHYYYYGEAIVPGSRLSEPHNDPRFLLRDPGYYVWPFFPGLDIARDLELHPTQQGAVILDGWDGIHPVPVDVPSNPVWFARNEDQLGGPAQMVGMPYIVMGWDDPSTPETENTLDAHSIFTDLEFSAGCPNGGLYTLDKFGGVFALGNAREDDLEVTAPFTGSPYFYPFLYAEDMEVFGSDETMFGSRGEFMECETVFCNSELSLRNLFPGARPIRFVLIPAGTFLMGSPQDEPNRQSSEGPIHSVTIQQPFNISETEVTQAQWEAVDLAQTLSIPTRMVVRL